MESSQKKLLRSNSTVEIWDPTGHLNVCGDHCSRSIWCATIGAAHCADTSNIAVEICKTKQSTVLNAESNHDSLRKSLLPSQYPSNVDGWWSTIAGRVLGRHGRTQGRCKSQEQRELAVIRPCHTVAQTVQSVSMGLYPRAEQTGSRARCSSWNGHSGSISPTSVDSKQNTWRKSFPLQKPSNVGWVGQHHRVDKLNEDHYQTW